MNQTPRPNRHERRRAWALVPRALKPPAPALDWLPPRTRTLLSRTITQRNALDRALAVARGLDPADPACARFQGAAYRDKLDTMVRRRRSAGLGAPEGSMAVAMANAVAKAGA